MTEENRIPELDAARGFCIIAMVAIHLIYDLAELYPVIPAFRAPLYDFFKEQGGMAFFLLSGICATLGHKPLRRGLVVFALGMAVSAVTSLSGFLPVRFGVLHCLGLCMILWPVFRRFSLPRRILFAGFCLLAGFLFAKVPVSAPFLYPLGLTAPDFSSSDYFPLFPYLGFFLFGSCTGEKLYPRRRSLFPRLSFASPVAGFFRFCGRHSLFLYLAHQPVLIFLIETLIFSGGLFHES